MATMRTLMLFLTIAALAACGGSGGGSSSSGGGGNGGGGNTAGSSFSLNQTQFNFEVGPNNWSEQVLIVTISDPNAVYLAAGFDDGQTRTSWLNVQTKTRDGSQQQFAISVHSDGLAVGNHTASFTVGVSDKDGKVLQKKVVSVTLKVTGNLQFLPVFEKFSFVQGDVDTVRAATLWFNGGATTAWTASADVPWLQIKNSTGVGSGNLSLLINAAGLATGQHSATITLTDNSKSTNTARVTFTIFVVEPTAFTAVIAPRHYVYNLGLEQDSIELPFTADMNTEWQAGTDQSWISLPNYYGSGSGKLTVTINPRVLPVGTHKARIFLTDKNNPSNISSFTLMVTIEPQISFAVERLESVIVYGSEASKTALELPFIAGETTNWTFKSDKPWLSASNNSGTGAGSLNLMTDIATMAPGKYEAIVQLIDNANSTNAKSLTVFVDIREPQLTVSAASLVLGGDDGLGKPDGELHFSIDTGSKAHAYTLEVESEHAQDWLQISSIRGQVSEAPTHLAIAANTENLHSGIYHANLLLKVQIGSRELKKIIALTFNKEANRLMVSNQGVALTASPGRSVLSRTLSVTSSIDRTNIPWTAVSNQSWLSVTGSGTTGGQLNLSANSAGLAAGNTYFAEVTISSTNKQVENQEKVRVGLTVLAENPNDKNIDVKTTREHTDFIAGYVPFGLVASPVEPLVFINLDNQIKAYNVFTGAVVRTFAQLSQARSMTISDDGKSLYVYDAGNYEVLELDSITGNVLHRYSAPNAGWLYGEYPAPAYLRPDARPILVGAGDRIYDLETRTAIDDTQAHRPYSPGLSTKNPDWLVLSGGSIYQYEYSALGEGSGRLHGNWIMTNYAEQPERQACVNSEAKWLYRAGGASNQLPGFGISNPDDDQSLITGGGYPNSMVCGWNGVVAGGANDYYGATDVYVYDGKTGTNLLITSSSTETGYRSLFNRGLALSGDNQRLVSVGYRLGYFQIRFIEIPLPHNE